MWQASALEKDTKNLKISIRGTGFGKGVEQGSMRLSLGYTMSSGDSGFIFFV
jgi:hypothetical protein